MTEAEVLAGISDIAHRQLGRQVEVTPQMRLIEELGLDSLQLLALSVEVENRFEVCLDEADEAAIETVGDLVAVVRGKLAAG